MYWANEADRAELPPRRSVSPTAPGRVAVQAAWAVGFALIGAAAGLAVGLATPTHVQIAGAAASVRVEVGQRYDELAFTGLLTGKRVAGRAWFGEPMGVSVQLNLDATEFVNIDGSFDPHVLPAYIQTYSNPEQLARDAQRAIALHLLRWVLAGIAAAALAMLGRRGYLSWRRWQDARLPAGRQMRVTALAYRAPERVLLRRAALAMVLVAALGTVPGSARVPQSTVTITPTPLLDGTPLAGAEVGGPLLPAFDAAEAYIRKYFADTNTYYEQVRAAVLARLDAGGLTLPSGPDVVNLGFVSDRHCNTGMDRVIAALLDKLDVRVLVSAGDDAFSGSFGFESACTAGLASASKRAHITDVFVGGNHDSPATLADEQEQGIEVLDGKLLTVDGLTFAGLPDPRTSRYGEGLQPSPAELRTRLIIDQGAQTGKLACDHDGPVIVVLHDPAAGRTALQNGCGKAALALDGHTHKQTGPDAVPLPDGTTGYAFTSASTGGAPTDKTIEHSFASSLTVGPLNHDATVNIVSVDRTTGQLVGVTEFRISPDQSIAFEQELVTP
jgi:predicted phosphodiesterase